LTPAWSIIPVDRAHLESFVPCIAWATLSHAHLFKNYGSVDETPAAVHVTIFSGDFDLGYDLSCVMRELYISQHSAGGKGPSTTVREHT
jgi:hypothetical protein